MDDRTRQERIQAVSLIFEVDTAGALLIEGLIALNRLSATNDFSHLPLQLLTQGFERLSKVVVCLARLESGQRLPTPKELRKEFGHDVLRLTDEVVRLAEVQDYGKTPALRADIEFWRRDVLLRRLLSVMSDFGGGGRYYDLDTFLAPVANPRKDPRRILSDIEKDIVLPDMEALLERPDAGEQINTALNARLTEVLHRHARALCRTFVFDLLGQRGREVSGTLSRFYFAKDEDLATPPRHWYER